MSYHNYANWNVRIPKEDLEKLCPVTYKALLDLLMKHQVDVSSLARCMRYGDDPAEALSDTENYGDTAEENARCETDGEELTKTYDALCAKFKSLTGIDLELKYFDNDDVEMEDKVEDGNYAWCAEDAYGWTPKGIELRKMVPGLDLFSYVMGG